MSALLQDVQTIPQLFSARVAATPDQPAYQFPVGEGWRTVTWQELDVRVLDTALGLIRLGVERGDRVAILGETRPEWLISDLAAQRLGAVTAGLYSASPPQQIAHVLRDSQARLVFVEDGQTLEKIRLIWAELPMLERVVLWNADVETKTDKEVSLFRVNELGRQASSAQRAQLATTLSELDAKDTAVLIYTSGTTGEPKGAAISHKNALALLKALEILPYEENDRTVAYLPMADATERIAGFYGRIATGIMVSFVRRDERLLSDIREVKPTVFGSESYVFELLYEAIQNDVAGRNWIRRALFKWAVRLGRKTVQYRTQGRPLPPGLRWKSRLAHSWAFHDVQDRLGGAVRMVLVQAGPTHREILDFFHAVGLPLLEAYGLSESSGLVTANLPGQTKLGTVGRPLPGCEIRIAPDGEILVRGPTVFQGYLGDPQATAEVVDEDGWLHTGDMGVLDAEDYLRVTDRKQSLIMTSAGKMVAPLRIERLFRRDAALGHVVVVGPDRPFLAALICLNDEHTPLLAEALGLDFEDIEQLSKEPLVREYIQKRVDSANNELSKHEQIVRFTVLSRNLSIQDGELTPTYRVRREVIYRRYAEAIEAMYD